MPDPILPNFLPNFLVVGQGKAGTSLFYRRLLEIPGIGLSEPKELHYFSANAEKPLDWYAGHFAHLADRSDLRAVGEISPSYLKPGIAARLARNLGTDLTILFSLRHPIRQFYARYLQNICAQGTGNTFHAYMEKAEQRLETLAAAIDEYYDVFGAERIVPLVFERDVAAPGEPYLRKILDAIGLGDVTPPPPGTDVVNPSVMPRYLYSGRAKLCLDVDGAAYEIPARRLVFCAQGRNNRVTKTPGPDDHAPEVLEAFRQQSRWSPRVTPEEFARWHDAYVVPFAARLTEKYGGEGGLDLSAWDAFGAPGQEGRQGGIAYRPAPPPEQFRVEAPDPEPDPEPEPEAEAAPVSAAPAAPEPPAIPDARLGPLLRALHVSPRHRVTYLNNAKVACSSIKLALQRAELGDPDWASPVNVHDRKTSPLLTWPELTAETWREATAGTFVFSVVRAPWGRLRSAYLNKVFTGQKDGNFRAQLGFARDERPSFEAFIMALGDQEPVTMNAHWRPQWINIADDLVEFDVIGRLETIAEDWARVAEVRGLDPVLPRAGRRTGKAAQDLDFTPAMTRMVREIYAEDFTRFGYSDEAP